MRPEGSRTTRDSLAHFCRRVKPLSSHEGVLRLKPANAAALTSANAANLRADGADADVYGSASVAVRALDV